MATNKRERSNYSDAVAAQIRGERAAANVTQAAVYEAAGLSRSTYIRIEGGEHVVDATQLARICAVLGITMSDLLRRAEERIGDDVVNTTATVDATPELLPQGQDDADSHAAQGKSDKGLLIRGPKSDKAASERQVTKSQRR